MGTKGRWTIGDIPDQRGRTVLITGGNTGAQQRRGDEVTTDSHLA